MVARICLPLVSLWTALRSGWRPSPHALSLRIDRSWPRTLQQKSDIYGIENDDKMQTCTSWSTSRAVPMSFTALEMQCDAENDTQMQVGAAPDASAAAALGSGPAAAAPRTAYAPPLHPSPSSEAPPAFPPTPQLVPPVSENAVSHQPTETDTHTGPPEGTRRRTSTLLSPGDSGTLENTRRRREGGRT